MKKNSTKGKDLKGEQKLWKGPITIGARSKVTSNCLLRASIPPDSLVEAPAPKVSVRSLREPHARPEVDR